MYFCRPLALSLIAIVLVCPATLFLGQNLPPEAYLYAHGKRIPLNVSTRYAAYTPSGEGNAWFTSASDDVRKNLAIETSLPPRANIKLFRLPQSVASRNEFLGAFTSVSGDRVPVYSLGDADLVAQREVLIGLSRSIDSSSARAAILSRGAVKPLAAVGKAYSYILTVQNPSIALSVANELATQSDVEYAEPNFIAILPPRPRVIRNTPIPNPASPSGAFPSDPFYSRQWPINSSSVAGIHTHTIWNAISGLNTRSIVIAILDEGVDTTHPDLKDKIVSPFDAFTDSANQQPNSWDGHGTACAGIAAAGTNNLIGVAGVAFDAKIMPVRIGRSSKPINVGDAHPWITTWEFIARGIRKAVDNGADVLSNSWSGGYSDLVNDAIDYAISSGRNGKGAVLVFAAGNEGAEVNWPANLSGSKVLLAVGATNESGELKTRTSSDGEDWWGSNHGPELSILAPGVHIFTTDIRGAGGYSNSDYFDKANGTSSATPFVAGTAALILSLHPDWTASQVRDQIENTASPVPAGVDSQHGIINVCKAVFGSQC